jgi:prepilin-type N-terminal cleavage/methylation domain-containing protein
MRQSQAISTCDAGRSMFDVRCSFNIHRGDRRILKPKYFFHAKGYTLIELVVVMVLISIIFFVALPRLQGSVLTDQSKKVSRWILAQTRNLKQQALRQKKDFVLHVDMQDGKFWISSADMEGEALVKAQKDAYRLPESVSIMDVTFARSGAVATDQAEILFYAKGYSDRAFIHLQDEDGRRYSFLIEPFLPQTQYFDEYAGFQD